MVKYLILDFGKVLAYPTTGYWFITPMLYEIINEKNIDVDKLLDAMKEYNYILSRKVVTIEEEFVMFYDFYENIFETINFCVTKEELENIAYDITYNDKKYKIYENVKEELEILSKKYKLLLLSDNWPCGKRIMKNAGIDKYFDKIYISSIYGVEKKDKVFFDIPIEEYNIKKGEAIFIDDNESLLDIAIEKDLDVRHMDREKEVEISKYKIINNLLDINF